MEKVNWKLDEKNHKDYLDLCRRAVDDEETFSKFRSLNPMTMIVENSPLKSGKEYYDCIEKNYPGILWYDLPDKFLRYDNIGNPVRYDIGNMVVSPTTMRYIKTLGDLIKMFGDLSGKKITEIGGGYGGLCRIIRDAYFNVDYTIYDLPEAQALQKKFLYRAGYKANYKYLPETDDCDILIAMYSWSELSDDLQKEYLEKVISRAKNCYIMLNYEMEKSYQLLKDAFPNADIQDYNIFYDDNNTEYAPYNRFVIIKN